MEGIWVGVGRSSIVMENITEFPIRNRENINKNKMIKRYPGFK